MHQQYYDDITEKGYTHIPAVLDHSVVNILKNKIQGLLASREKQPLSSNDVPYLNQQHDILYNLQNKDQYFFQVFTQTQPILEILKNFLNDRWYKQISQDKANFILRSLLARSSGSTDMPLHIDSFIHNPGLTVFIMQVSIILEDQNCENGCTLVVPGSHKFDAYASQEWKKFAVPIESKAGDVVIWDSRLWHGALGNQSKKSRWSVIGTFCRWWIKQNFNITSRMPENFLSLLTKEERSILGYCSIPPMDEYERLDIKMGFEKLKDFE